MSAGSMFNHMRVQAALMAANIATTRLGLVSSYDPGNFLVKVRIQPNDIETGWLPIMVLQAGVGWGMYAAPAIGDQAVLAFTQGDVECGICLGFLPNDEDRPPTVPAGEAWLVHRAGHFVKLTATGIESSGAWTHTGDINVTGTVTATTDVIGGSKHLATHTHGGVQGGGSHTAAPD
jgi:phage baseplate assembly protein gpV